MLLSQLGRLPGAGVFFGSRPTPNTTSGAGQEKVLQLVEELEAAIASQVRSALFHFLLLPAF